jgi:phage terminase large subunit
MPSDALAAKVRQWIDVPPLFVREVFDVIPDKWQDKVLEAFPKVNRIAGAACKNPGKTALEAWLGWNFMFTRPHCKVPCTSITGANLRDGLWTEFAKWQNKSDLLKATFTWTQKRIFAKQHEKTWWASFRTWDESSDPEDQAKTLAGLHEDYLLFLIDEVGDIPEAVVASAEAALGSGIETKLVMMGNCTRTDGPLFRACNIDRKFWFVVHITGDPDDPERSPRINIEEARRMIEKYGRDSYFVKVNILGEFPERAADKLIDMRDCELAQERKFPEQAFKHMPLIIGVDVAYMGDDKSVLMTRRGCMSWTPRVLSSKLQTDVVAEQLIKQLEELDGDAAFVDRTGVGVGVINTAQSRGYGRIIHGISFAQKAIEEERFFNRRAEMYWSAAEWVKNEGCLPKDSLLAAELAAHKYSVKKGRIILEEKDDVKARLGRSPDRADAFVLTFAAPVQRRVRDQVRQPPVRGATSINDYDPLAG